MIDSRHASRRGAVSTFVAAAIGCMFLAFLVAPAGAVSPRHHWRTIRSDNFIIIYSEGEAAIAARALAIAEQAAAKLDARFHWTPREPVRIVLTDDIGVSNGFTTFFPNNVIQIYVTPPSELTNGLQRFGDWLRFVITHEYTHMIQLSMAHGWPVTLRNIFGRDPLWFPGRFQPTLLVEGLAVHEESKPALDIGRSGSPLFAMEMRAELNAGLKPWNEVSMSGVTDWPAGNIPYLYGSYFYKFFADTEGERAIPKLVNNYSDNVIPFMVSPNFSDTTGKSREQLWRGFTRYLQTHVAKPPYPAGTRLTHGQRLTHFGYATRSVRAAPDGRVFFIRSDYRQHPALMVWQPGEGAKAIAPVFTPASIDFNPAQGVLIARPEVCHEYKVYFDLYRVDPDDGDTTRLTHCGRYRYATWSPDGRRIIAVHRALGVSSLVLLNADGKSIRTLWTGRHHEVLGAIDWSPAADEIVAAVWRPTRGWTLEKFGIDSQSWHVLTAQAGLVGDPQYAANGHAVLFTSDAGGVYNLRRIDLASGQVTTLTHVVTGAFSPSQGKSGGPIYYLGYTDAGYDLFKVGAEQTLDEPLAPVQRPELPAPTPGLPMPRVASQPYSPWPSLAPKYWSPVLASGPGYAQLGVATSGSDALGLQNYSAALSVYLPDEPESHPQDHMLGGYLYYRYADRFTAGIERGFRFDMRDDDLARVRRQDYAQAIYTLPFVSYEQALTPMVGIAVESERDVVRISAGSPPFNSTTAGVALDFNTSHVWPISVSPGDGQDLLLVAESSRPFGGDFNGNAYRIDWHDYISLGSETVLMLHYLEGYATDGARPFNLGGAQFSGATPAGGRVFNYHDFRFRGYPSGLLALTGHRLRKVTIEGRIGVIRPEAAWYGVGLHQMSVRPFVSAGAAWDGSGEPPHYYKSAGIEAVFDLNVLYLLNTRLTIGFAHGFDEIGENQVYASLSVPLG